MEQELQFGNYAIKFVSDLQQVGGFLRFHHQYN